MRMTGNDAGAPQKTFNFVYEPEADWKTSLRSLCWTSPRNPGCCPADASGLLDRASRDVVVVVAAPDDDDDVGLPVEEGAAVEAVVTRAPPEAAGLRLGRADAPPPSPPRARTEDIR